jgi:hypothetical protein
MLWIRLTDLWTDAEGESPAFLVRGPYRTVGVDAWGSTLTATRPDGEVHTYDTDIAGRWRVAGREWATVTISTEV